MGRLNKAVNISRKRFSALIRPSRGSHWKCLAMRVVVCCLAVVTQAQSATEYQVKAAFLFNFAKFVEWPADAFPGVDAPLQICLLGQDPFGHEFEEVIGDKSVNGTGSRSFTRPVCHRQGAAKLYSCLLRKRDKGKKSSAVCAGPVF